MERFDLERVESRRLAALGILEILTLHKDDFFNAVKEVSKKRKTSTVIETRTADKVREKGIKPLLDVCDKMKIGKYSFEIGYVDYKMYLKATYSPAPEVEEIDTSNHLYPHEIFRLNFHNKRKYEILFLHIIDYLLETPRNMLHTKEDFNQMLKESILKKKEIDLKTEIDKYKEAWRLVNKQTEIINESGKIERINYAK